MVKTSERLNFITCTDAVKDMHSQKAQAIIYATIAIRVFYSNSKVYKSFFHPIYKKNSTEVLVF